MGQREPWESGPSEVSAADCRAQLTRILDSAEFDTTDRGRRFLRYVVEETLAGRGDRIKAYSVAVEVFGRDASTRNPIRSCASKPAISGVRSSATI